MKFAGGCGPDTAGAHTLGRYHQPAKICTAVDLLRCVCVSVCVSVLSPIKGRFF